MIEAEVYVENRVPDGKGGRTVNRVKVGRIFVSLLQSQSQHRLRIMEVNKKVIIELVTYDHIVPERFILKNLWRLLQALF